MTTPPRAVTKAGVIGTVAAGALLMSGALRVPTPEVPWLAALQAASSVESMQGAADALPPLKVVSDPGRQQMGFILPSGEIESREVAPVGRWFPLSPDGRTGFLPVPFFPRVAWGAVDPPPSDMQPRRLTAVPEILNPSDVLKAMDEAYPTRLREQRLGGTVGVLFLVEPTGVVQQRRVGQVSAYPDLDAAALEIARAYRFSGASTEEGAVPVWVSHAIDFRVE